MKTARLLLFCAFFTSAIINAQVKVTFKVDITDYLAAGNTLGANGIRIGGDFAATAAMNGTTPMPAWSPSDAACAMVLTTGNVWSIEVTYPASSIGMTQPYKFVNNDWGTNEGTADDNKIAEDGCGSDDGAGNVNRQLVIPSEDLTLQFCWDRCFRCDGSSPIVVGIVQKTADSDPVSVYPNPVLQEASFSVQLKRQGDIKIMIFNLEGKEIATTHFINEVAGKHVYKMDVSSIRSGYYLYRIIADENAYSGNFIKR